MGISISMSDSIISVTSVLADESTSDLLVGVEAGLAGAAGLCGFGKGVVDFESDAFDTIKHQKSSFNNRLSFWRESRTGSSSQRVPCCMCFGGGVVVVMRY